MKLFLLLSFLLTVITSGQGVTYCIKPNATATCRAEDHCQQVECHIVQYYFDNVDKTINQEKDVTMIFLEGTHTVTDTVVLSAPTLSMIGKGQVVRVVYNCCNCSLLFSNTDVSIQNLNIMQLQQLSGIDSTLENCSCYFAFWNTAAVLENFYAYKASIAINSSSVSIRGKCEFAGSTAIAIASGLSSITVSGNVTFTNNTGILVLLYFCFYPI